MQTKQEILAAIEAAAREAAWSAAIDAASAQTEEAEAAWATADAAWADARAAVAAES